MSRIIGAIVGTLAAVAIAYILANYAPIGIYIVAGFSLGWAGAQLGAAVVGRLAG